MASPLTVKVHPVVYMTMVDSFERRVQKAGVNNRALGTLLGFYEKNVVQVTSCYAIPFRESLGGDLPEINDVFNQEMWQVSKRAMPSEQIVGWFFTVSERELPLSSTHFHFYYTNLISELSVKKELPPVILLTMDVSFSDGDSRFPVRAYIRGEAGVPGKPTQATIFQPLKVSLDAFAGENAALGCITKGIDSERREIHLDSGLEKLDESLAKMIELLESHLKYVKDVLASGQLPADASIGRKLMEMVSEASTQLSQDKLEKLVKNSLRDYMMVSYLANLTKTQLAIQEKIVCG